MLIESLRDIFWFLCTYELVLVIFLYLQIHFNVNVCVHVFVCVCVGEWVGGLWDTNSHAPTHS